MMNLLMNNPFLGFMICLYLIFLGFLIQHMDVSLSNFFLYNLFFFSLP